ncbi:DNA-directed RNA polymerase subunit beta' [Planctomycetota bacterium]
MDLFQEHINEYNSVLIKLASSEEIRSWSYGEVKKPETINYRTFRSEKDGLFCERIFGPEKDWECFCGKYKGMKYKGVICDRCSVEITQSRVRRKRMGHVNLAAPVVHIWFFKIISSPIGQLLGIRVSALERLIFFQDYVVTEVKNKKCPLKVGQVINEESLSEFRERHKGEFNVDIGAKAVKTLLSNLDLESLGRSLKNKLSRISLTSQKAKEVLKRLRLIEMFLASGNKPEWMVLDVIPVIPPALRPLIMLESGNFATSDLNDLYRRLINRNNRLKKLMELNAPEVIIRNEKRMLQQAVDALFDNERCRRPALGAGGRPLKSLSDMIKGKQGRFRENLLGKRVDYSARSVIVIGPELKLNQCGLPKRIALELYQPFLIKRLKDLGRADTIKTAKKMVEQAREEVWDVLDEVIKDHPVLLNRAPTLHRLSIQAFDPVLVEGNAISIHPLVCTGFNADFDGDQMAVHLPLSIEAQLETKLLMKSVDNVFSPRDGQPVVTAVQDIVLGIHYLTLEQPLPPGQKEKFFASFEEVIFSMDKGEVSFHTSCYVKIEEKEVLGKDGSEKAIWGRYRTTPGRLMFNDIFPEGMPYYNHEINKKEISKIIQTCAKRFDKEVMVKLLDSLKELGLKAVTRSGLSIGKDDLKIPEEKNRIIEETKTTVEKIEKDYREGVITSGERYNRIVDCWTYAREAVADAMLKGLKEDTRGGIPYLNPLNLMVFSGARGSIDQIRQLAGMRGLIAKPSGEIIETPIKANFREGLSILEYFSSTHGARKGLADTALKTADAGYLTRKLVDVAQNMVITCRDCGTLNGITKSVIYKGEKIEVSLGASVLGRTARDNIVDIITDRVVVEENVLITRESAKEIEDLGFHQIRVRSPLTCEAPLGLCALCYGMDLAKGKLVEEGQAVGIVAAQSIGEPGTQLTMRTFHIGGTASWTVEEARIVAKNSGCVKFNNVRTAINLKNEVQVVNRNGELVIEDDKKRELEKYVLPAGSVFHVKEGEKVKPRTLIVTWDPHNIPVLAEKEGRVRYEDIIKNVTMKEEVDSGSGHKRKVIIEHKGDHHPQIVLEDKQGNIQAVYALSEKTYLEVSEGDWVKAGSLLAKTPREIIGTQDITGGLPRVTELLEARKPKDPAVIAEIDGIVELGEKKGGKRTIIVQNEETKMKREHMAPYGKHLRIHRGDRVQAGESLTEGPLVPHDILRISGLETLQNYMLREIQGVYRIQSVEINDKHIEIIIAQMLRKVKVQTSGDTDLLPEQVIDKFKFQQINQKFLKKNRKPATAQPLLLGITKASLRSESFIAAASFQETTKVLMEAALAGRRDHLRGLKENVILGHIVPCGTGFRKHNEIKIRKIDKVSEIVETKKAV